MEAMEKEFEIFFSQCKKQGYSKAELQKICRPLVWQLRLTKLKVLAKIALVLLMVYLLYTCFDCFSWCLSALGRLLLIHLLPHWNWTALYNARCLIERPQENTVAQSTIRLAKYETDAVNCVLCESLNNIPAVANVTYSSLESVYLERGLPVIITDSHRPKTPFDFLDVLQNEAYSFLQSEPCDIATNLMLRKLFNLELALQKIKLTDKWFLQLRNCKFSAVKSSRVFVTRPYYYPLHLEPFYSSWILMSRDYAQPEHEIYLQGLIIVQQISGHFDYTLQPKQPCDKICPNIKLRLGAGEALMFSTDLWIFSYGNAETAKSKETSIATVLEIDWHL